MGQPVSIPRLVTEEEYLALPESTQHTELVDGEVIVPPSPTWQHQQRAGRLFLRLQAWADGHPPAAVGMAPLDVRFGPARILQPDLFVVLAGLPDDAATPLDVIPDLVIEVLSGSNRAYDRLTKRALYADAGVREYWVVDPMLRQVEIHRVGAEPGVATDRLTTQLLPGFELDLLRLW